MDKILIVDDEEFILSLLKRFFTKFNIDNQTCSNVNELDKMLNSSLEGITFAFIDYHFFDREAHQIVSAIKAKNPDIRCVVMSGDPDKLVEINETGLLCCTLNKPFRLNVLQELLEKEGLIPT